MRPHRNKEPRFWLLEDFVASESIHTRKLIRPIIPEGSNGLLYGESTAGKTQLALTLGAAVASGEFWLSKYGCRKGRVAFLQVDSPEGEFKERSQKLLLKYTSQNFAVVYHEDLIDVVKIAAQAEPPEWVQELRNFSPDLFIVDSLNKIHMEDEDSRLTPMKIFQALRTISGGRPTVLVLHHARKVYDEHQNSLRDARGSIAWVNDVEFVLFLKRTKDNKRILEFPKTKGAPDQPALPVMIHPEFLTVELEDKALVRGAELIVRELSQTQFINQMMDEKICSESKARAIFLQLHPLTEPEK